MNDKHIDIKDHDKVLDNIFPIGFCPVRFKEEYKGCLFVYDDNFSSRFEKILDRAGQDRARATRGQEQSKAKPDKSKSHKSRTE
jgi:hypothetical protein